MEVFFYLTHSNIKLSEQSYFKMFHVLLFMEKFDE